MAEENSRMTAVQAAVLLGSLFILSACAILYELLISTVSTYLLGSSVLHFSVTIGLFLSFLGVGAFISKWLQGSLLSTFILIEILLGLAGGASAALLHIGNAWFEHYYVLLVAATALTGILAGMEIPIVTRLLENAGALREVIARVLTFDYLGALVASLLFPLLLLPLFGSMRTAFFTGLINCAVAFFNLLVFKDQLPNRKKLFLALFSAAALLGAGFFYSFRLLSFSDALHYQDKLILTRQTPYQRIVVTRWNKDLRLYLNGNLQFCSIDEYRYHEPLVHLPMLAAPRRDSILLLGAGDGLALREIFRYSDVKAVDLVDLDAEMLDLARKNPLFTALNNNALSDPRVRAINDDAFNFVKNCTQRYNVIIVDLPDPSDPALGKLYSAEFYSMLKQITAGDGVVITQSTSPFLARKPFWCIHATMKTAFPTVAPIQAYVPSFGQWGFQMAFPYATHRDALVRRIEDGMGRLSGLRFLNKENIKTCFVFDTDNGLLDLPPNTLDRMSLVDLYQDSFSEFH